jgi:hypothetical protein
MRPAWPHHLKSVEADLFDNGVVLLRYEIGK